MDFTFLEKNQIYGDDMLDVLESVPSDYSIILGCGYFIKTIGNDAIVKGTYFTKTPYSSLQMVYVDYSGGFSAVDKDCRTIGVRPAVSYSSIKEKCKNEAIVEGITSVEYGEYPQTVVSKGLREKLEELYLDNLLIKTNKVYTIDEMTYQDYNIPFKPTTNDEYFYNGSKYVRLIVGLNGYDETLSDDSTFDEGEACWIKVEPIKWLIDKRANVALSEKILVSGIQFDSKQRDFEHSDIKNYLDTYFANEIIPSRVYDNTINLYGFDYENVSEEEIIKGAVESDVAVFLHGKSGDGKSDRVRELDRNAEIIYLRNATPDSLNGKSVFNSSTGEMIDIPPTWYKRLVEKCEKEPDKIHILFFDELTNALPSIQGMAFNIVLNKEVNGKWKLPENSRIIAAGNDLEESRAANELAEPLFNRFAHVYIKTTVEDWLKWAGTPDGEYKNLDYRKEDLPSKIHPSIYAYIAYKSYSKQDVLRTPYNGKTPNADPRKWEMASKVLYRTRKPEMLRALLGEDLTKDFIAFTSTQVLSVEDVINGNYDESGLEMNVSQKYSTAVGLSSVSEEHIEVVRDFVKRLGPEVCAMFDTLWTRGDESRLEKIAELKMSEKIK